MTSQKEVEILLSTTLYSQECVDLLQQALEAAQDEQQRNDPLAHHRRVLLEKESDGSDEEDNDSSSSSSSSSEAEDDTEKEESATSTADDAPSLGVPDDSVTAEPEQPKSRPRLPKKSKSAEKQHRVLGTPPVVSLSVNAADDATEDTRQQQLQLPSSLLSKAERQSEDGDVVRCRALLNLSKSLAVSEKPVIILLLRSGRFAGGVFQTNQCVVHRACTRYTTRRGQGKAQSSMDGSKGGIQSMGAQLRRAGEEKLQQDVMNTLNEWKQHINQAALIWWSCPKPLMKSLFSEKQSVLSRDDSRLRHVPLDIGRPTFESVCAVHEIMMQVKLCLVDNVEPSEEPELVKESAETKQSTQATTCKTMEEEKEPVIPVLPLTPLHQYAAEGNLESLQEYVKRTEALEDQIDQPAGEDRMTPLHYAADSCSSSHNIDPSVAADVVSLLLLEAHASPCMVDARNRVPYFLASHDKVREAFRTARATLGEDCWSWDEGAKVGPPLTQDDVERKKEKAAEKKRRQRARQKEKKAKEKAQAEEMAQRLKEEEEKQKREEDAKRVRDGLQPKTTTASNVCDFCQKVCKGKRRSQMFQRLDYVYCCSECVAKHKRELMASAAMSRLG